MVVSAPLRILRHLGEKATWTQLWDVIAAGPSTAVLRHRNRWSHAPVVGDADVVVSMATYERRFTSAYLALECIGRGRVHPRRLVLWVDDARLLDDVPPSLRRLRDRGLELRAGRPEYGPHNKYYPYARSIEAHCTPLVTADDDALYTDDWLENLLEGHREHPDAIIANRAHRIAVSDGAILPYRAWSIAKPESISPRTFATGRSGVLHPPRMLDALREAGDGFLACAPRADDIWLHAVALRNGIPMILAPGAPRNYRIAPVGNPTGLSLANVLGGGNDRQIAATYAPADIAVLAADAFPRD